jgi:pentapeptide MXKDX repeat protein
MPASSARPARTIRLTCRSTVWGKQQRRIRFGRARLSTNWRFRRSLLWIGHNQSGWYLFHNFRRKQMKQLLAALIAATFAIVSVGAIAAKHEGAMKKDEMKKDEMKKDDAKKDTKKGEKKKKDEKKDEKK